MQPAFVRIHQDFVRTVLRGGKPDIVKDMRAHLGRDVSLEEFKYWTALVMPTLCRGCACRGLLCALGMLRILVPNALLQRATNL